MGTEIVRVKKHRCAIRGANGVQFPQLYRVRGDFWDSSQREDLFVEGAKPAPMLYTLSPEYGGGYSKFIHEPIVGFEHGVDSGRLVVRHHTKREFALGYLDAAADYFFGYRQAVRRIIYSTDAGLFTLSHRKPILPNEENLVIYASKNRYTDDTSVDDLTIVHSDGRITSSRRTLDLRSG